MAGGIGEGIAKAYAAEGATVLACDLNEDGAAETAEAAVTAIIASIRSQHGDPPQRASHSKGGLTGKCRRNCREEAPAAGMNPM